MPRLLQPVLPALVASVLLAAASSEAQMAPAAAPVTTLKANARIVVVDVVVTDGHQRPVHDLKQSDFSVLDNNEQQTITHFEQHRYVKADPATVKPMPALPRGVFTNVMLAPESSAINVLLLDSLNTPLVNQAIVRQQLLKYLEQASPGTRVAIFGLGTRLSLLQGFTTDPEVLKTVLKKNWDKNSPLMDDAVGGGGTQNSLADDIEDEMSEFPDAAEVVANLREFDAMVQSTQLQMRAKYTLDAMNQIARYLSGLPGRKNLMWFSGSFPIDVLPDMTGNIPDPFIGVASSEGEFRDTIDMLARSQVAVYPIDARGLFNNPMADVTTTRNYSGPRGTTRMNQDLNKFFNDTASEQLTMRQMAVETGGRAYMNNNGLAEAMESAVEDGSNYYTLTYTPSVAGREGDFRKIKMKLAEQGLNLSYRQGYYVRDAAAGSAMNVVTTPHASSTPPESMRVAMMRGAPTPAEIKMRVGVIPFAGPPEDKPAKGNFPTARAHRPYRRYTVNFSINTPDIYFYPGVDGKQHGDLDLVIFVFDVDGVLLNSIETTAQLVVPPDREKEVMSGGMFFHQEVSAPAKGEYFLRVAVHDRNADRYGVVEVATSAVKDVVGTPPPTAK